MIASGNPKKGFNVFMVTFIIQTMRAAKMQYCFILFAFFSSVTKKILLVKIVLTDDCAF
jgi:hypothetical protein